MNINQMKHKLVHSHRVEKVGSALAALERLEEKGIQRRRKKMDGLYNMEFSLIESFIFI